MRAASPLRYPGGKWRIAPFFERLLLLNNLVGTEYVEPYAGGSSLALSLLFSGSVSRIHLNDLDPAVYSFWWAILNRTERMLQLVEEVPLTVAEWRRQRLVYAKGASAGRLALGFAMFFLNRTNHSGILNGGLIGGKAQTGPWKMDARFNRTELQRRIQTISERKTSIRIHEGDALDFLQEGGFPSNALVYLDPPYFKAGQALYLNSYKPSDHERVKVFAQGLGCPWLVSYDDVDEIRKLYRGVPIRHITLLHTARAVHIGREVMFFSPCLKIPRLSATRASQIADRGI